MSDSLYQSTGGALKLKGVGDFGKKSKKKKKKKNTAKAYLELVSKESEPKVKTITDNRTPAQKAFDRVKEKRQEERILEKAQKKHKDHVEEFNRKLDQLTEHFDIPKVSWTK